MEHPLTEKIGGIAIAEEIDESKFGKRLWNLAKKSLPNTNRCKKMFAGYLATFMLRTRWKGKGVFKLFMKYAAKLYSKDSIAEETEAKCFKISRLCICQ
ncbi:Uncharacterized protein APZ42_002392 [Daphnia magna]|uniref:Uncharacterized protein n=1 Tax=Daphnia magna TaxID=35525 RepID=A0A162CYS6_9CRUS|nr:Uncharacterized protein APZ42_002392 [Daphnia magna]